MKLYSAWYCPFAQRAWLALLHKKVEFEYIEIDPYKKTKQWLNLSRQTGQVPVLAPPQGKAVVDSNRIIEFADQVNYKADPLFSNLALENAEQKFWIDFTSRKIVPYFYRLLKNGDANQVGREAKVKMLSAIEQFSRAITPQGSFFSGASINAVDLSFIPFAYRINVLLKHYHDFELPTEGKHWQRYHRWYSRNVEDPVFQQTATANPDYEDHLIEFYLPYSLGGGQADVVNL